jgi:hypothetical protein
MENKQRPKKYILVIEEDDITDDYTYIICVGIDSVYKGVGKNMIYYAKSLGFKHNGFKTAWGHTYPTFNGLIGPFYNGVNKVRYEDQKAYNFYGN